MLGDSSFVFLLLISNLIPSWSKNGLPKWCSGKESTCQCKRHRLNPWVKKIPWRRKWQPTLVFLLGKSHGQRSLEGYSPWSHKELDTEWLSDLVSWLSDWAACTVLCRGRSLTAMPWLRGGGAGKPRCSSRGRPGFRGTLWVASRVPRALSTSNS